MNSQITEPGQRSLSLTANGPPRRGRPKKKFFEGTKSNYLQNNRTEFLFPTSRQMFEAVKDKYHLRDLLLNEGQKEGIDIQLHTYGFLRNDRSYIYTKCLNCNKTKFKFLKIGLDNPQPHKLFFFDNTHTHSSVIRKKKHLYNMAEIFELTKDFQKNAIHLDEFRAILKKKYQIDDSHAYYILSRFRKEYQSLQTISQYLMKNQATIWTQLEKIDQPLTADSLVQLSPDKDPSFFMFSLPKMRQNFQRYGDCCYFNISRGLVKKKTVENKIMEWEIIAFNGLTFQNRFAPFALAFLETTPESFEKTVELMHRVFNWSGITPKTLITPYQPVYTKLVQTLRNKGAFNGLHIYDALEELQLVQKVISDKTTFKYFQDIVQSTNRQQYNFNIQKLYKNVAPTLQVRKMLNSLQEKAPKMCFGLIKTDNFIGMGFKFSANRYMSILIRYLYTHNSPLAKIKLPRPKELFPSIKHIAKQYIKNVLKQEIPYIKYEMWKLEISTNIPEVLLIRNRIKQSVLEVFFSKFHFALKLDARQRYIQEEHHPNIRIYDFYDKNTNAVFVVAPRAEYNSQSIFKKLIWRCNCLYSLKCGLPCEHEIKVVLLNNGSLLDQIHDRWIEPKIGKKKAPGRPKSTRTNTMK